MTGWGGNPPMRPDQIANLPQTRAGSGPAPASPFVVAQRVTVFGPNGGVFVFSPTVGPGNLIYSVAAQAGTIAGNAYLAGATSYSASGVTNENGGVTLVYAPTAAAGNLKASVAPVAGTDGFGNAYVQGVASYGASPTAVELTGNTVTFIPSSGGVGGHNLILATSPGQMQVLPGTTAADSPLTANFNSKNESTDTLTPSIELTVNGGKLVSDNCTAWNPTSSRGAVETWHSLGTLAGYTVVIGRYKLTNDNHVELDIKITGGGANAATVTFSTTLPAQYRPVTQHDSLPMGTTRAVGAGDVWPRLLVDTAGNVTINATANNSNTFACCQAVPLD